MDKVIFWGHLLLIKVRIPKSSALYRRYYKEG